MEMARNDEKKGEPPEFSLNGSVLNSPGISEEVRQAYINDDALISFKALDNITPASVASVLSSLCWLASVFAFGYLLGMSHQSENGSFGWFEIIPAILLLAALLLDRLTVRLKMREEI